MTHGRGQPTVVWVLTGLLGHHLVLGEEREGMDGRERSGMEAEGPGKVMGGWGAGDGRMGAGDVKVGAVIWPHHSPGTTTAEDVIPP